MTLYPPVLLLGPSHLKDKLLQGGQGGISVVDASSATEAVLQLRETGATIVAMDTTLIREETSAVCEVLQAAAAPRALAILLLTPLPVPEAVGAAAAQCGATLLPLPLDPHLWRSELDLLRQIQESETRLQRANQVLSETAEVRSRELHAEAQRFQMLFEQSSDFVFLCSDPSLEGTSIILAANPTACAWSGYHREQLVGRRALDLLPQDPEPLVRSRLKMLQAQQQITVETPLRTAWGEHIPLRVTARFIETEPRQLLVVGQPAEGDAQPPRPVPVANLVYEVLLTTGEVRLSGAARSILNLNEHAQHAFTLEEWMSRIHPLERQQVEEVRTQASAALGEYQARYRYEWSPGLYRLIEDVGVVIADEQGQPRRALGTLRDVSGGAQLPEEHQGLLRANRLENLGMLASGIAHDFNNILAAIIGLTDLSMRELPEDSEVHEDLKEALQAAHRAKELVRQILSFTRQTGQERVPLQLHSIAREALHLLRPSLPPNVQIMDAVARDAGSILGNPVQMHQVIMNLCVNAAQAIGPEGGRIELRVENVDVFVSPGRHEGIPAGQYVLLSVADTGSGMAPEVKTRLFEPFFTTKEPGQGTGMGLPLSRDIVLRHEGHLRVESEEGLGSTFAVYFPRIASELGNEEPQAPLAPRGTGRILFVDDEATVRKFAEKALTRLGYEVTLCEDGQEALAVFETLPNHFDVLVTDQIMPELSGTALATAVHRQRPDLPILLFTGYSEELTPQQVREAGFLEVLTKPVPMRELGDAIHRALARPEKARSEQASSP